MTSNHHNDQSLDSNSKQEKRLDCDSQDIKTIIPEPMTKLLPPPKFFLDQVKNGVFFLNERITKNRLIFGRARDCDVIMNHPSISRYHAALLWAPKNEEKFQNGTNTESFWYLVDCGSTHGTLCNKKPAETGKMIKLTPNNNIIRFGASTRLFILGADSEEDNQRSEEELLQRPVEEKVEENEDSDACTWGMSLTDCSDETEEIEETNVLKEIIAAMKNGQSYLQSENDNVFKDNPYKCLKMWFERAGYDFDPETDAINNKFKCTVELPIDGQQIPIEGQLMNRKQEALSDVCLKCCRLLDQVNLLFPWQKKDITKRKNENEFYDDDDDLIDETVNRKKCKNTNTIDNYESLNAKWKDINSELCKLKVRLATIGLEHGVTPEIPENLTDSLDIFYATMNQKKYGLSMNEKIEKSNLKIKIKHLEEEQSKIEKLIQIAKPAEIILKNPTTKSNNSKVNNGINHPKLDKDCENENNTTDLMSQCSPSKNKVEKVDDDEHTDLKELKNKPKSLKDYKKMRKLRQESIIEDIEKEKRLEKQRQRQMETSTIEDDRDFVDWIPPVNQSGDGRTYLNDKFGY